MPLVKVAVERHQVNEVSTRTNKLTGELEFQQKAWVYKYGSRFPTEYLFRLPPGVKFYPEGDYVMELQANIQPDKYLGMSINPFAPVILISVSADFLAAYDKAIEQVYALLAPKPAASLSESPVPSSDRVGEVAQSLLNRGAAK